MLSRARRSWTAQSNNSSFTGRLYTSNRSVSTFRIGDRVLLKRDDNPDAAPHLTKPLKRDGKVESHRGAFAHNDIIGKQARDVITSTAGRNARLHRPTLAEYIVLTPRLVTPIYPEAAERIASLLDLHADADFLEDNGRPLEILEAGTGHGSLTLHLAKAIHGANRITRATTSSQHTQDVMLESPSSTSERRAAVVHTIDKSPAHSKQAMTVVNGFRGGLYADDVDFHVGTVASFIEEQQRQRDSIDEFLDAIVLDLPMVHRELPTVASSLITDGTLATFCPQITQIIEGIRLVRQQKLPLFLDKVVELGSTTVGGRQWDLRLVRPKPASSKDANIDDEDGSSGSAEVSNRAQNTEEPLEAICHPKYGEMITASGFLAIWKKMASQT